MVLTRISVFLACPPLTFQVNFAEVMGLQSSDSYRNVFAGAGSPSLSIEKVFPWGLDRSTSQPMKSGRVASLHRATSLRENR